MQQNPSTITAAGRWVVKHTRRVLTCWMYRHTNRFWTRCIQQVKTAHLKDVFKACHIRIGTKCPPFFHTAFSNAFCLQILYFDSSFTEVWPYGSNREDVSISFVNGMLPNRRCASINDNSVHWRIVASLPEKLAPGTNALHIYLDS